MSEQYATTMESLRRSFRSGKTADLSYRKSQLLALRRLIEEGRPELTEAVFKDIRRCSDEAFFLELKPARNEIDNMLQHLDKWAAPKRVPKSITQLVDTPTVRRDPLGVVLVISPWNYPLNLSLAPIAGAIAGGNCVVLKPSEVASHTADALAKLVAKYMDSSTVKVIKGGAAETTDLLKEQFDHILYTGNPHVGRIVMQAAAKHLTPVTLELGGKSPVIIDPEISSVDTASKRIAWGKFLSAGQTCISPDFILCPPELKGELIKGITKWVEVFYGQNPQESPDFSRIVALRHWERLANHVKSAEAKVVYGGQVDANDLYIGPTILDNVTLEDPVMKEEIFGPILPIIEYKSIDDAISLINNDEKPLAMYIFSDSKSFVERVLQNTSAGGVTVNDCLLHFAGETLPFGGVGKSGIGRYHGKHSFDTFTHEKSVLLRPISWEFILSSRYPPFSDEKRRWMELMTKRIPIPYLSDLPFQLLPLWTLLIGLLLGYFAWGFGK